MVYADTSIKNEDTWYRVLGYYDTKYDTAQEIGKPSHWAVAWKALYTFRAELQRQSQRPVCLRQWRRGGGELELAQQRLER